MERLEEAIHSFLRQDYPGTKELIVLNDIEGQTLVFDHPEVQVVNVPRRFHSAAEKLKAAVGLASHDLIFPWPEDDISLPHRLSFTVAHLAPQAVLLEGRQGLALERGRARRPGARSAAWRQRFIEEAAFGAKRSSSCMAIRTPRPGTPTVRGAVRSRGRRGRPPPGRGAGGGLLHPSRRGRNGHEHPSAEIPRGRIQLRPRWRRDYGALGSGASGVSRSPRSLPRPEEIPFPPPFYVIPPPPPVEHPESLFRGDYPLKISVILPATNESVLLKRTVEQFVATLPENSEVIVIDNGSTDGCADFLAEQNVGQRSPPPFDRAFGRVRRAQSRPGRGARRGRSLFRRSHGPARALVGAPRPHAQPTEHGGGRPRHRRDGQPDRNVACGQRIANNNLRLEWLVKKSAEPCPVPTLGGGFMAMRHETLKRAGTFDEGMPQWGSEDLEICVRYWLLGYEVWVVPEVTVLHYFRKARPYGVQWHLLTHNCCGWRCFTSTTSEFPG